MEHSNPNHQPQTKQPLGSIDEQQTGFMIGAVLGALVGGAAALLLSPKSGKEMRDIVKKYSKELEAEAYELAKESRGVASSFKSVLEDGATEVMEIAPEKIEQASNQAQQLAEDLNQKFESARDVVSELAEAFRSGWEEYGEDHPAEQPIEPAPALFAEQKADDDETSTTPEASTDVEVVKEEMENDKDSSESMEEPEALPTIAPVQSRRRTQSVTSFSMHTQTASQPEAKKESEPQSKVSKPAKASSNDPEVKVKSEKITELEVETSTAQPTKSEPLTEAQPRVEVKRRYETRVLEEPKAVKSAGVEVKMTEEKPAEEKKEAKPTRKKLLFRRSK